MNISSLAPAVPGDLPLHSGRTQHVVPMPLTKSTRSAVTLSDDTRGNDMRGNLTRSSDPQYSEAPYHDAPHRYAKPLSILLIDDDPGLRWLQNKALTACGYRCSEAADGHSGILAFQQLQPDLIIMDIMMPDLDGFALLETIRRQSTTVGIIMLSALSPKHGAERALRSMADGYLGKPATFQLMIKEIERVGSLVRRRSSNLS